ncbi:MAG: GyrI-like domain-containing protein [Fusobacteria bacterium]|nr:GyrI-like domain-containing protein [Fusobacteriota bacterium]
MKQNIITKADILVIGIQMRTSNEKAMEDIPKLWNTFFTENIQENIPNKVNGNILAIYTDYEGDFTNPYTYILGCEVSSLMDIPKGMLEISIPSTRYEIFTAKGKMPDKIVEMWQHIWSPKINAKRTYMTDFEVYGDKYGCVENSEVEIYIGVK